MDILEHAKVALVPGLAFGPSGEAHLRINFGREMHDIDLAFERLDHYFRDQLPFAKQHEAPQVAPVATKGSVTSLRHLRKAVECGRFSAARRFVTYKALLAGFYEEKNHSLSLLPGIAGKPW